MGKSLMLRPTGWASCSHQSCKYFFFMAHGRISSTEVARNIKPPSNTDTHLFYVGFY